jgi:hypothetical protein
MLKYFTFCIVVKSSIISLFVCPSLLAANVLYLAIKAILLKRCYGQV